jgi:ABC-type Fe3+ transport system substrate-binding protein
MKLFAVATTLVLCLATTQASPILKEETKTLDQLYADAIAEGGKLIIYAGGDIDSNQAGMRTDFKAAFPKVNLTIVVDYSKYHDVRIDNQLARDRLVPDIAALQTLQNFPRWARQGDLLQYKPAGFSQIRDGFKDPKAFWMAIRLSTFGFSYDEAQLDGLAPPTSPLDLIKPEWANKIASAYPNDDDATLFVYSQYAKTYGWEWVEKLAAQQVEFNRGTNTPGEALQAKRKVIAVGSSISLAPTNSSTIKPVLGKGVPFLLWGQRLAIFKKAPHPAAAKLYLNWVLSKETQTSTLLNRSVRKDVTPPLGGTNYSWDIVESNVDAFPTFMADRAEAERLRQTFSLYFGEVQGKPSPGWLGLLPGQ